MWFNRIFTWREYGGLKECPYFRRTIIDFKLFSIRFHRWYSDDDPRTLHCHPFSFLTIVLSGGYTDVSDNGNDKLRAGSIRFRDATYRHSVRDVLPGTRTVLFTGPVKRRWGFYVDSKYITRDKYFAEFGHHPCDPSEGTVRVSPDGTRIE